MITRYKNSWNPDLPDRRDHVYSVPQPRPLPPVVDLSEGFPPPYDQGDLGSCVANSVCAIFDFERKRQSLPFMGPSRLFNYYNTRLLEGTELSDAGSMIRDSIKSVSSDGLCADTWWPYIQSQFPVRPSQLAYDDATQNQALAYKRINPDLLSMLTSLADGLPFAFGFSVYQSIDQAQSSGLVPLPSADEPLIGGHAVVAVGYDQNTRLFRFRNSWGTSWHAQGHGYLPFDYLTNESLSDDRWQISLVENSPV